MDSERNSLRWMLPVSGVLLAGGAVCLGLLLTGSRFSLPKKPALAAEITSAPLLDRSELAYVPPREKTADPSDFTYDLTIDMDAVRAAAARNHDVAGWIHIPDTPIDYAIMQCDDNDFYVHHNESGAASSAGAIFADFRCDLDSTDNSLLYGHNMGSGSMFHAIKNFKDHDWGMAHRYIEVATLEHRYLYRLLSCNVISGLSGADFEYWTFIDMNRSNIRYFRDSIKSTSETWYADDFKTIGCCDNRLLVLQTCNSGANDGIRCCVFAELVGDATNISQFSEKEGLPGSMFEPIADSPVL